MQRPTKATARRSFPLGQVVATPNALEQLEALGLTPFPFLVRHAACDWGDLDHHDTAANNRALKDGSRLFSSYNLGPDGKHGKVWVITEADRSATTVLMPDDY
jgi:hypothetical protein